MILNFLMCITYICYSFKEGTSSAMGCFKGSDPEIENQERISRVLEEKIIAWNKEYKKSIKLLLLGMTSC
jgi:hypothetical protein